MARGRDRFWGPRASDGAFPRVMDAGLRLVFVATLGAWILVAFVRSGPGGLPASLTASVVALSFVAVLTFRVVPTVIKAVVAVGSSSALVAVVVSKLAEHPIWSDLVEARLPNDYFPGSVVLVPIGAGLVIAGLALPLLTRTQGNDEPPTQRGRLSVVFPLLIPILAWPLAADFVAQGVAPAIRTPLGFFVASILVGVPLICGTELVARRWGSRTRPLIPRVVGWVGLGVGLAWTIPLAMFIAVVSLTPNNSVPLAGKIFAFAVLGSLVVTAAITLDVRGNEHSDTP